MPVPEGGYVAFNPGTQGETVEDALINLAIRISSVVYSIWENTVDEYTQTYPINFIGSSGNLATILNPAV